MNDSVKELRRRRRRMFLPLVIGIVIFSLKLSGQYGPGSGYGLLLVSVLLMFAGVKALSILVFTNLFSSDKLIGAMRWLFWTGGWLYVIAVFDLSGYFTAEALAGNVELRWILFGPLAVATLAIFDIGMYQILVQKNRPNWDRYPPAHHPGKFSTGSGTQDLSDGRNPACQSSFSQRLALAEAYFDLLGVCTAVRS